MFDEIAYQNMIQRRDRAKKLCNILKELYPKEYECKESLAILKALHDKIITNDEYYLLKEYIFN